MTDSAKYRAKAAKKPLQFWLQPFMLLLLIILLWRLLPVAAVLYKPRVIQPLSTPHVSYVKLDAAYASEVLRSSMQAWRRIDFGSEGDAISFEAVEPFEPLGDPRLLEQGSVYPGRWTPDDVTPLALRLPSLLYRSDATSLYASEINEALGVRIIYSPSLRAAEFEIPEIQLSKFSGSGSARFYVETDEKGAVAHVLVLDPDVKSAFFVERALYQGSAAQAVRGELEVMWRNL